MNQVVTSPERACGGLYRRPAPSNPLELSLGQVVCALMHGIGLRLRGTHISRTSVKDFAREVPLRIWMPSGGVYATAKFSVV